MSGSGISWAICKSAPRSRQITTPVPHHSVFYRPDALPATQPTASKHWRHVRNISKAINKSNNFIVFFQMMIIICLCSHLLCTLPPTPSTFVPNLRHWAIDYVIIIIITIIIVIMNRSAYVKLYTLSNINQHIQRRSEGGSGVRAAPGGTCLGGKRAKIVFKNSRENSDCNFICVCVQ